MEENRGGSPRGDQADLQPTLESRGGELKRGASLGFVGGLLEVRTEGYGRKNGSGTFIFKEDELVWGDGEDHGLLFSKLLPSEIASIRDFLNKYLPPADSPTVEELQAMILDVRREPGVWRADVQAKLLAEKIHAALSKSRTEREEEVTR